LQSPRLQICQARRFKSRSTFHPHAQPNAFHCRDVRQQSRSVRPHESTVDRQPQLHPDLLRLSAMISQYFTRADSAAFFLHTQQ
jgi:hypothetical protein